MKEKIILISMSPYEESIVNKHYFKDKFEEQGHSFEYWSICDLEGISYKKGSYAFARYFKSVKEVVDALDHEKEKFYCNLQIALTPKLYPIFKAVEKNAVKLYEIRYLDGSIVVMNNKTSVKLLQNLKEKLELKTFIKRVRQKIVLNNYKKSKVRQRLILFTPPGIQNKEDLKVHHLDYEINKEIGGIDIKENYILFLDQALADHPDLKILGVNSIDKLTYLKKMNKFFDLIEKRFNYKIIIAAHPKSNYNDRDFGDRKIIKYETAKLSKYAKAILTHYSTSFNYAVLNNKPLILLTMDDFFNKNHDTFFKGVLLAIGNISKILSAPNINIDKDLNNLTEEIFEIDSAKYNNFKNNYLILKSKKEMSNFEIVYNYLFPKR